MVKIERFGRVRKTVGHQIPDPECPIGDRPRPDCTGCWLAGPIWPKLVLNASIRGGFGSAAMRPGLTACSMHCARGADSQTLGFAF